MLEQIVQVRVRLHFIRAAGHDCARRVSGRSEAQSLDEPPALRTITWGKMEVTAFLVGAWPLCRGSLYFSKVCTISERAVTADDGVISLPLSSPVSSCL